MSDKILQVIDPEGDIKEQLQAIRDNFLSLQKDALKGAAQVIAYTPLNANTSFSTGSFESIGLKSSITTSGGLVLLVGVSMLVDAAPPNSGYMQLTLDDDVKASTRLDATYNNASPCIWAGTVGAGLHVIDLQFQKEAGSPAAKGGLNNYTYLMAVEFII